MNLGETSTDILIEQCELHPLTSGMRIDVEKHIDKLADDIRRHKQMQPGRVIVAPSGRFQVYMGSRRFLACKLLFNKRKLKTYKAFIDDELTDEEIIERSLAENATEEKGKLTPRLLEEMRYFAILQPTHTLEKIRELALAGGMKKELVNKKIELLSFLTAEDAERLYRVEEKTGFQFDLELLKAIWDYSKRNKSVFLGACARAAKKGDWVAKGLSEDLVEGSALESLKIPWFEEIFPNVVPTVVPGDGGGGEDPLRSFVEDRMKNQKRKGVASPKNKTKTNDSYYYIPCKKCSFEIPIDYDGQMKGRPAVTAYKFKDDGGTDGVRAELDTKFDGKMQCPNCNTWWKLLLSPAGEGKIHVSLEDTTQEEEEEEATSRDVVERAVTTYSPVFNEFVFIDQDKWYFYDTALGRRRPMSNEEIEKHTTYFRNLLSPASGTAEKPAPSENTAIDVTVSENYARSTSSK